MWRIGDGETVKIWKDRWLPQPLTFKPQSSLRLLPIESKVSMMIDKSTHTWNVPLVNALISKSEADLVNRIPLSLFPTPDKLIWRCTPSGVFTVKSTYYLQSEIDQRECSQASMPTTEPVAWTKKASRHFQSFKLLVEHFLENLEEEEIIEFTLTAWKIWKRSNDLVFRNVVAHPSLVIQATKRLMEDINQTAQPERRVPATTTESTCWEAPPQGNLKLNWDAGLDKVNNKVGVGVIIRD
ncbi:hypothetical protein CIPAW_02G051300 [Carya illinoinensis]|uniref:Uncharacterized protein n=1 Tax=Carya illinoinensis TaxID=32201 RepID=A0A8T1R9S3_CARIL|nr:hypothetical protein CIPAW_02G051300 [Carya illinoinensis]